MNSKEALLELLDIARPYKSGIHLIFLWKTIEKDLEALEILKNKNVDIGLIKDIMKDNRKFECYPDENLTQEEFNIIKEWLEK